MKFILDTKFNAASSWYAYLHPTPYHIEEYEWFDEFSERRELAHLKAGQPFYCAYYGWWVKADKAQFGNNVDRSVRQYQTFEEARQACINYEEARACKE